MYTPLNAVDEISSFITNFHLPYIIMAMVLVLAIVLAIMEVIKNA